MSRSGDRWDARRWGVLLLALAQLVGPIGLQVADAVLEGHEYETPIHVEGEGRAECGGGHAHLICQTVRSLTAGLTTADAAQGVAMTGVETTMAVAQTSRIAPKSSVSGSLGSRAPPLA